MSEREAMPFSGSVLKWIAIAVMFLDHIGACLLEVFVLNVHGNSPLAGQIGNLYFWYDLDQILRSAGRMAFPDFLLFCWWRERCIPAARKGICCGWRSLRLLSEIPFDLALHNQAFYWGAQNVFFTLLWGFW